MKQRIAVMTIVVTLLAVLAITIVPITDAVTDTKGVLVIGDMYSSGLTSYVARLQTLPCRVKVTHYGHASINSRELLNDLAHNQELKKMLKESDLVIVSLGTNDLLQAVMDFQEQPSALSENNQGLEDYRVNLNGILNKLAVYHKQILLADLFNPLLEGEDNYQAAESLVKSYNQVTYQIASRNKVKVAPVNEEFVSYGAKADLVTDMDFGLTKQGDQLFAQAFMRITDSRVKELLIGRNNP